MKRLLVCVFATTLLATSVLAISSERLADLRAKAEAGNGISQYNLGLVYADPQEPIANIVESYVWFSLAADNGAPGKALMIVSNQMTPAQLAEGKKLLEQRRADLAAHRTTPAAASPVVAAAAEPDATAIRTELKKASDELATATQENQKLKDQLDKAHQTALDQIKQERDQLAAKIAGYTNEIASLRAASASFESERSALQQKIADAAKQSNNGAAAELAATASRLKTAENELAKTDAIAAELANTKQTLASVNDQLQKATSENQRLNGLVKQSETASDEKLAASEKTINDINSELLKTQAKLADVSAKAATAANTSAELATLRQSNADFGAQLQKLTAQKDQALAQAAEARQQADDLAAKLKSSEDAMAKATAAQADLSGQIAALKAAPPKQDPEVQARLEKLTADLEAAQRSAADDKKTLLAKLETSETALATATGERAELEQKLKAQKPSKKEAAAQAKIAQLKTELESVRAESAKNQASATELDSARKEISDLQAKLKDSTEALAAAKSAPAPAAPVVAATTEGATPDLQKELSETQLKLDSSLRSYQLQQAEVERLQNALANVDDERAKLAERLQATTAEAANASGKAASNYEAAAQLAGVREQLRQTQNQLASIAYENAEMKHRIAFLAPTPGTEASLPAVLPTTSPSRPGASKPVAVAEQPDNTPRTHTVVSGDNLSSIAKHYYGSASRWPEILEANKDILRSPTALKAGMKLKIP